MDFLKPTFKKICLLGLLLPLSGCFYLKSAYYELEILNQRVPMEYALKDPGLTEDQKRKMRLAQEAEIFAQDQLHLSANGNYTSFVKLDRPYVTYVVSASPKWQLEHHFWTFPFVGSVPYKGYFVESDAKEEEERLKQQDLDTYLRGVSAFSTLGWFKDPLLSTMLRYSDADLVNTLIHETVHATLYIKSNADFNERLAVFMGNWGAELFYKNKEGADSKTLVQIKFDNADEKIFADFISKEIEMLKAWYQSAPAHDETLRMNRLKEIQERFATEVQPRLKEKSYETFSKTALNNARLLLYKTYLQDLSNFQRLAEKLHWNYQEFLESVKTLEKHPDPEQGLKSLADN